MNSCALVPFFPCGWEVRRGKESDHRCLAATVPGREGGRGRGGRGGIVKGEEAGCCWVVWGAHEEEAVVVLLEPGCHVVGVEDGEGGCLLQALGAHHGDVGIGDGEDGGRACG